MKQDHCARPASEAQAVPSSNEAADDPTPELVTVAEVASVLRVSKMTIYRMIDSGELPAFRVGRSFRIRAASMRKLLSEHGRPRRTYED